MSSASASDDDEMAAFMGFSTFGKAPAAKKRKFNPATDSFVEGEQLRNVDRGGKKGQGSGGNQIPLGKSRVIGAGGKKEEGSVLQGKGQGRKEGIRNLGAGIGMGMGMNLPPPKTSDTPLEGDEGDDEGPRYMDTSLPPPRAAYQSPPSPREEDEDEGPRYMDTSLPPPIESGADDGPAYMDTSLPPPAAIVDDAEAAEMQARIDRIMASIQPPPGTEDHPPPPSIPFIANTGIPLHTQQSSIREIPRPSGLPARPPGVFGAGGAGRGRTGGSDAGGNRESGRQRGERNEEWYLGYYDPAFNENPWEKLEKEKGLESVGTWVERPKREVR